MVFTGAPTADSFVYPAQLFHRNCGPRFVRKLRFDPVVSRHGLKLCFGSIANLAPQERLPLGFRVGENAEYVGVAGHLVNFFEGGSSSIDLPPYTITIRFLDGNTERNEQHIIEGHPLPNGGAELQIYPALDDKEKQKRARESIGSVMLQLAKCEHDAYSGADANQYDRLLKDIDEAKQQVHQIALRYMDSSFEAGFLAVSVLDVQLDEATKLHFISRAQGSFWTVYQQVKGWRKYLSEVLKGLT